LRLSEHDLDRNEMLRTDLCNRLRIHAPAKRPIPERGAFAATDRPRGPWSSITKPPAARPAPYFLAETRPQVDARLTTPIELRARCSRRRRIGDDRAPLRAVLPVPRRFRPRARL